MKRFRLTLIAACILALNGTAWAQSGATDSYIKRTAPRFESFAGSSDNYASLANGLRSGSVITLTGNGETVAFNSPTKPMGYGNVTRSLDLAQRQLAAQGISNPTPSQLQAAMMGGTITNSRGTVTYQGVLQQRASGMGWGQIARSNSLHPGMGKSAAAIPASSSRGITSAAGGSVAASGRVVGKPESPGARGREQARISSEARISSAAGGNASLQGSGRGQATSGAVSNAGGGGMGGGMGGGHGGGQGGGRGK